jgi:hypothetical protein
MHIWGSQFVRANEPRVKESSKINFKCLLRGWLVSWQAGGRRHVVILYLFTETCGCVAHESTKSFPIISRDRSLFYRHLVHRIRQGRRFCVAFETANRQLMGSSTTQNFIWRFWNKVLSGNLTQCERGCKKKASWFIRFHSICADQRFEIENWTKCKRQSFYHNAINDLAFK